MYSSCRKHGFTLIELLVVIAIIAILAAILFPVFAKAREKARQSSCASNLKQIGLSMMQYVQDYDETYPYAPYSVTGSWGGGQGPSLGYLLSPYHKSAQLWRCPSDSSNGGAVNTSTGSTYPGYKNVSYAYNMWFFSNTGLGAISLARIDSPAEIAPSWGARTGNSWVFDHTSPGPGEPVARIEGTPQMDGNSSAVAGHSEGGNFLYADGHVKWMVRGKINDELVKARASQDSIFRDF